jgi:double-stranded uracil-DNA glycosylase
VVRGFDPIAGPHPRVLVLGSIPSERSVAEGRYYAHPRNCFWRIMQELFAGGAELDYPARVEAVTRAGVAIWDVLHAAERRGSLDSAIETKGAAANDTVGFLRRHPTVESVFFNGATAERLFERYVEPAIPPGTGPRLRRLPSTSPANAGTSYEAKLDAWRAVAVASGRSGEDATMGKDSS